MASWRLWVLSAVGGLLTLALALREPVPQDQGYHLFADRRSLLGVPNFWNVASNLPFLFVGLAGLRALRREELSGLLPGLRLPYALFFAGAALVALGSACYHLRPDNQTLVWDRLPMTVAFMAFAAAVMGEYAGARLARLFLPALLLAGVASVLYWHLTESEGRGDLRPYILVQFLPILLIPLATLLYPSALNGVRYVWGVIGVYAAAKALELLDAPLYRASGLVSGHTLKHLAAAASAYLVLVALRRRSPVGFMQ